MLQLLWSCRYENSRGPGQSPNIWLNKTNEVSEIIQALSEITYKFFNKNQRYCYYSNPKVAPELEDGVVLCWSVQNPAVINFSMSLKKNSMEYTVTRNNEQYMYSSICHSRPFFRVRWSPFLSGAFLFCYADCTITL